MPENQDKKISYKILTAEELLKEEAPPAKEIEIPKPTEIIPPETKPIKEEPSKEEIFYAPQKEVPFRPKPELLQKEAERKEIPKVPKRELKLPAYLLRFVFFGGGFILIFLLILFLKPQEKFKAIFRTKEEKKEEEIKIATPTETVILFPTSAPTVIPPPLTPTPTLEITTPAHPEITTPTITLTTTQMPSSQIETKSPEEISFLTNYSSKEINLKSLDFSTWQEEFKKFLSLQEFSGTKININFLYNKNKISFDFLFDYFIKPSKISSEKIEEFKNNFTGSYGLLIYYSYTRKYPILIFEVKDKEKALKFNQEWEKFTMKEDLKTLFLGFQPPKTKNNFVTKKQGDYSYRILDFGDNFKIIWALADNYLIYSTTETGIKDIFDLLK
jgi:hypothetical protein